MIEIFQNIRQPYDFAAPCAELAPYVEFFSQSSQASVASAGPMDDSSTKMFASWSPTCYLNLGASYVLDVAHRRYHVRAGEDVFLLRNTAVVRHKLPADNLFTLKFYSGGLEAVLGLSQVAFTDHLFPLTRILPAQLLACLKQPLPFRERVAVLEHYLLRAYRQPRPPDHYLKLVRAAIGDYEASSWQLTTSAVAERHFLTSKTINRYFHRVVGTSPKHYFALLRARSALTAFVASPADFAPSDYGYYDSSHFGKAMHQFTGQRLPEQRR